MAPPHYNGLSSWLRLARLRRCSAPAPRLRRDRRHLGRGVWLAARTRTTTMPACRPRPTSGRHRLHARPALVAADRTVVVGQSAGGWGTLALLEPESAGRVGHDRLRRRPRRPSDSAAASATARPIGPGEGGRQVRLDGARADALDQFGERQLLRAEPRATHGRRLQQAPAARPSIGRSAPSARTVTTSPAATAAWRCGRARSRSSSPPCDRDRQLSGSALSCQRRSSRWLSSVSSR